MKQSANKIKERREYIYNLLLDHGSIIVKDIASELKISELTIRRDLDYFESNKIVERFYGGAKLISTFFNISNKNKIEQIKTLLAIKAAEYVEDGDVLFLNTSSTVRKIIDHIKTEHVTIITNNAFAIQSPSNANVSIIFTGGEMRSPKYAMVGDYALQMLDSITANKAILGCSGLSVENGVSTSSHSEVSINKKMFARANGSRILVVDHTKFLHSARFSVTDLSSITTIITDDLVSKDIIEEFNQFENLEIIQVSTAQLNFEDDFR